MNFYKKKSLPIFFILGIALLLSSCLPASLSASRVLKDYRDEINSRHDYELQSYGGSWDITNIYSLIATINNNNIFESPQSARPRFLKEMNYFLSKFNNELPKRYKKNGNFKAHHIDFDIKFSKALKGTIPNAVTFINWRGDKGLLKIYYKGGWEEGYLPFEETLEEALINSGNPEAYPELLRSVDLEAYKQKES